MKTIERQADELVLKVNCASSFSLSYGSALNQAIVSVEHTIKVLNSVFEKQEGTTDITYTTKAILEQTELLTELKSRT